MSEQDLHLTTLAVALPEFRKFNEMHLYLGVTFVVVSDEGKAPGSSCSPLSGDVDVSHISVFVEQRLQILYKNI